MKLSTVYSKFFSYMLKTIEFIEHQISSNESLIYLMKHIRRKNQSGYYKTAKIWDLKINIDLSLLFTVLCQQKIRL